MGTLYIVMAVHPKHRVQVLAMEIDLNMKWAEGMAGVVPIFFTEADAIEYQNFLVETKGEFFEIMEVVTNDLEGLQ